MTTPASSPLTPTSQLGYNARLVKMGYPASGAFATARYWYGSRQYYCSVAWQQRRGTAREFSLYG